MATKAPGVAWRQRGGGTGMAAFWRVTPARVRPRNLIPWDLIGNLLESTPPFPKSNCTMGFPRRWNESRAVKLRTSNPSHGREFSWKHHRYRQASCARVQEQQISFRIITTAELFSYSLFRTAILHLLIHASAIPHLMVRRGVQLRDSHSNVGNYEPRGRWRSMVQGTHRAKAPSMAAWSSYSGSERR